MTVADKNPAAHSVGIVDVDEARRARARRIESVAKWVLPVVIMGLAVMGWAWIVQAGDIPHYILPGPGRVWDSLVNDWGILINAAYLTGWITLLALILAVLGGAGLAILFNQSKMLELSFYPYAVILQVTPVVSIAPLIFIYVDSKIAGM
ncbi:MAG: ABC transporter permease, partial [Rhodobacteraceae bacterium]|nr:ABC transporter permease [Paracoccaceae bacterium]